MKINNKQRYAYASCACYNFNLIQNKGREWPEVFNYGSKYLCTYIIGHYNPLVRIIDLVSQPPIWCVLIFIHKWRDLQFKVDSERQIF